MENGDYRSDDRQSCMTGVLSIGLASRPTHPGACTGSRAGALTVAQMSLPVGVLRYALAATLKPDPGCYSEAR